jgi:uncharacterized protein
MAVERIHVTVVDARSASQSVVELDLPLGATVLNAVERARLHESTVVEDSAGAVYGVFGVVVSAGSLLKDGDRVEIYRPLVNDPKTIRRRRAGRLLGV